MDNNQELIKQAQNTIKEIQKHNKRSKYPQSIKDLILLLSKTMNFTNIGKLLNISGGFVGRVVRSEKTQKEIKSQDQNLHFVDLSSEFKNVVNDDFSELPKMRFTTSHGIVIDIF